MRHNGVIDSNLIPPGLEKFHFRVTEGAHGNGLKTVGWIQTSTVKHFHIFDYKSLVFNKKHVKEAKIYSFPLHEVQTKDPMVRLV